MSAWNPAGDVDNDDRWPEGHAVEVRFPVDRRDYPPDVSPEERAADRETWPWLPGEITTQCGPDEWEVAVYDDRLATLADGKPAPQGTPDEDLHYPLCFRGSSEIREPQPEPERMPLHSAGLDQAAAYLADVDREAGQ